MIFLSVTKIFQDMLVLKIVNEGFMVNQHSISVTSPEVDFQFPLATIPNLEEKKVYFLKKIALAIIYHITPWQPM